MSKKLLITGVSGFIGRHVAEEAMRRGYSVAGIDSKPCQIGGVEFTRADIRDRDSLVQAMKDREYVIHLAAITSNVEFITTPLECYDVNANGFLNIIDLAAKSGCKRFVYA